MKRSSYDAQQKGIDAILVRREEKQESQQYYSAESTQWVRDALARANTNLTRQTRTNRRAQRMANLQTNPTPVVRTEPKPDVASSDVLAKFAAKMNER